MRITQIVAMIFLTLIFVFDVNAQCPISKYGIVPVWPQGWTNTTKDNWYQTMSDKGMGYSHSILTWPELLQIQNNGQLTTYINYIQHLKKDYHFKYHLLLRNPSLTNNSVPVAYQGLSFEDTALTHALYDFSIQMIDSFAPVLDYLTIGGESDMYFETHLNQLDEYVNLLSEIADYLHSNYPSIKFATTLTMNHGIMENDTLWQLTKKFSDMLSVTYWPLNTDFTINSTAISGIQSNISMLLNAAGNKPLILKESGLPSSNVTNSSELIQSQFIEELFRQTMNIDQIEIVGWDFLADYNSATSNYWVNFQKIYCPEFRAYISSLGLMDTLGNAKPAYTKYLQMMDLACLTSDIKADLPNEKTLIFPNPANSLITIDTEQSCITEIYTVTGIKILSTYKKSIDISLLKPSIYFILVKDKNGKILMTHKLLKENN